MHFKSKSDFDALIRGTLVSFKQFAWMIHMFG